VKEELILQKYARALFEVADEQNSLDEVNKGLQRIDTSFKELPQLADFLTSPQVDWKDKAALTNTLTQGLSPFIVNFTALIMQKERQFILPGLAGEFQKLLALRARRKEVVVTTVIPLPEPERLLLEAKLREIFAEEFVLENKLNPDLIAGFRVKIGHTVIDGSVKRKLEELRHLLAKG